MIPAGFDYVRPTSLDEALGALEHRIEHVSPRARRGALGREYEPVRQVAGRLELHGPEGRHGGVDVRGDGSAEAYVGWIRKRVVGQERGESAVDALRRELAG
jgi:hypothetical protein